MGDPACFLAATCLSCGRFLESAELGLCPHCGQPIDGSDPPVLAQSVNTILYCRHWAATVRFYREVLGLATTFSNEWFVEFSLGEAVSVSVAEAARSSIQPVEGQGITLSVKVSDLPALHKRLTDRGAQPGPPATRFDSQVFDVHDPEGHRIEFWEDAHRSAPR